MTWKTTVEEATTVTAQGEFDAEVTGIDDRDGQHGPMVRMEFKLATDDDGDERRVTVCRPRWNWTSPMARMCRQPMRRSHGQATEAFHGGG